MGAFALQPQFGQALLGHSLFREAARTLVMTQTVRRSPRGTVRPLADWKAHRWVRMRRALTGARWVDDIGPLLADNVSKQARRNGAHAGEIAWRKGTRVRTGARSWTGQVTCSQRRRTRLNQKVQGIASGLCASGRCIRPDTRSELGKDFV